MMGEHICGGSGAFESMMPSKSVHEKISIVPPIDTATASAFTSISILLITGLRVLTSIQTVAFYDKGNKRQ